MKHVLLLTLFAALFSMASAKNAKDFTVKDTDGNTHTLFSYLNDGKYVLVDFFYTT